jgi:hypothetical protein
MKPTTMLHRDCTEPAAAKPKAPSPPSTKSSSTRDAASGVSRRKDYGGLCHTCNHAGVCTFPRREGQPVLSCDEFEGASNVAVPTAAVQRFDNPVAVVADRQSCPGLCGICARRETCTFPKPDGGVWHCDEFE